MKLIRAATICCSDLERSTALYTDWLDYRREESGTIESQLANAWGSPAMTGRRYAVLRPASGHDVFLRFVESDLHPDFVPLRSFGWAAIEICVQDVLAVNERMIDSPFEIIGPPRKIEGLDAIHPMQVKGPDGEIVYLTQINADLPEFDLPRAESLIDRLFILVMGCSDMDASLDWIEKHVRLSIGRRRMEIVYTMLAKAFDLPETDLHAISTMVHDRDIFLELDQLPSAAVSRPQHSGALPPGVAIGTFWHPDFETIEQTSGSLWIQQPATYDSVIYSGKRAATLHAPDGTLIEVVEN